MSRHARRRRTFYAGRAGSKYHRTRDCQGLDNAEANNEVRSMSRHDVLAAELDPCRLCLPPLVSLVVVHGDDSAAVRESDA